MKRFIDYGPVETEIKQLFDTLEEYKLKLNRFDDYPGGDYEKLYIAHLLFLRGKIDESHAMIMSIKDDEYRRDCLEEFAGWSSTDDEIIN